MTTADMIALVGSDLGVTISTTSKPTEDEVTDFLEEAARDILSNVDASYLSDIATSSTTTDDFIVYPSGFFRLIAARRISTETSQYVDCDIMGYKESARVIYNDNPYKNVGENNPIAITDQTHVRVFPSNSDGSYFFYISNVAIDDMPEEFVMPMVHYALFKAKMQDEEMNDAQLYYGLYNNYIGRFIADRLKEVHDDTKLADAIRRVAKA
jgi:hypothetical protein